MQVVASLRPALLFWATALRPLPLHPLMTADNVPPVRAAAPIVSSAPNPEGSGSQLVPKVDEELLAQVKQDIWRTSGGDSDSEALVREQIEAVDAVLGKVEVLASALAASSPDVPAEGAGAAQLAQLLSTESLNAVIAPQLPLLMMRGYPEAARSALGRVRTVAQHAALLALTQYMGGVYEEMSGKLGDLQWQQLQKLRELCDAANDGGTEQLMETAVLMKEELDTDFCNYLNFAIEQEEKRLEEAGLEPVGPAKRAVDGTPLPADGADTDEALLAGALATTAPEEGAARGGGELAKAEGGELAKADVPELAEQRWLLVLRLVRQGVYALLAKDYEDDVKWVRYIIGLSSPEARRELTERALIEMSPEQKAAFSTTVTRISDNLSVQRDARDLELYNKVLEIKAYLDTFDQGYSESASSTL